MKKKKIFQNKEGGTWLKKLSMLCLLACFSLTMVAQKRVTGTVTDAAGETVIGANVVEKGTTNGTSTDADGKFALTVKENATIVISFIGYVTQEIRAGNQSAFNVMLKEDAQALDEVVVVGYGTQKKIHLTGAVAQIRGETLENRSVTNLSQALQGQVANLNIAPTGSGGEPGAALSINIRGYTGLGSSGSPLIVIDGIQGGDINDINMNDVESISVLKDAASAAIYGSNAPYGVLLITTKRGKTGQKPTITYSNNFGWAQPINLPEMMNSLDFATFWNEAAANSGSALPFTDETIQRIKDYMAGKIDYETIASPWAGDDYWQSWQSANANNDWFDIFMKDFAFKQQHTIGVSGGTTNSNYYVGLGYLYQGGMWNYGQDSYQRYNARTNLTTNLTNWLTFSFRGSFSRGLKDAPNLSGSEATFMNQIGRTWPTNALYNPDGTYNAANKIVAYIEGGRNKETRDNAILTGEFVFHPLKGWDITANYAYDGTYVNGTQHLKTVYTTTPSGKKTVLGGTSPSSFTRSTQKNQHHTVNLYSSYEKEINDHYFKVLVGYTQELYDNLSLSARNNYLYSDENPSLSLSYGTQRTISEGASQLAVRGGFGRFNYNYKEKYLFEFDGRYDGTSRFLNNVRYKFYPGVSAGWVVSKESFWKPLESLVNLFKLRAEYGSLGDQSFTDNYPFYPALNTVSPTSSNFLFSGGRESYISNPGIINTLLTWVTTKTLDFGVDLSFLANQLNISFDWYKRSMNDYVGPAEALPAILGASAPQTNSAAMETKGWELTIGWKHHIGEFGYGANIVLSDYWGIVNKYPNPNGLINTWYEGQRMGDFWGYETVGYFKSAEDVASSPSQNSIYSRWTPGDIKYADLNGDGKIDWGDNTLNNSGDKKVIGNGTPRYSFGVTLNADYKGVDFNVFLQGVGKRDAVLGNDYFCSLFWGMTGDQWHSNGFVTNLDRWSESNPNGYFPKYYFTTGEMVKNIQPQTKYMQNAAYMRVKNLQLGYTVPSSILRKLYCQKLRLFFNVENLATITKMVKVINPELSNIGGTWGRIDGKIYPLQRTWAGGVNITF
jgi:TonB-linked SusC/RagA family outer membrane protein